jgi:peptidoglycan/xylan/chitin deacetylase (PgdA/CDA1 family)
MIISLGGKRVLTLGYHKIGRPPEPWWSWYYIDEEVFAVQLATLINDGWCPIDISTFLRGMREPGELRDRSLLVTFDDGYKSFAATALPVLQDVGCPAVVFVPTDHIGGRNLWDEGIEPNEEICDWEDLLTLEKAGVAVQSHGASHRALSQVPLAEWDGELLGSKLVLEQRLAITVNTIAYPYGDPGNDSVALTAALGRAGYAAGFLYGGDPVADDDVDLTRLPRATMGPDTDVCELTASAM